MNERERNKIIVRASAVGIGTNVLLAGGKAVVGLLANSIAVVLERIRAEVLSAYPDYRVLIAPDIDLTD